MKFSAVIIFLLLFGSLWSCKKFPEGPAISLRCKENRVKGEKMLEAYTVNGADSLSYLLDSVFTTCQNHFLFSKKAEMDGSGDAFLELANCEGYDNWLPGWTFVGKNKLYLKFSLVPKDTASALDTVVFQHTWDVLRLTRNEMWLDRTLDSNHYEMRFVRF